MIFVCIVNSWPLHYAPMSVYFYAYTLTNFMTTLVIPSVPLLVVVVVVVITVMCMKYNVFIVPLHEVTWRLWHYLLPIAFKYNHNIEVVIIVIYHYRCKIKVHCQHCQIDRNNKKYNSETTKLQIYNKYKN